MSNLPSISCLCPTFARPPQHLRLLEECVESFRRANEEYAEAGGRAELIVLNDCCTQELTCAVRDVHIVNTSRRFRTLGEKYNALVGMSQYDVLAPWEDDDISLPHRLLQAGTVVRDTGCGYWNPRLYWFWTMDKERKNPDGLYGLKHPGVFGYAHGYSAYTREAFHAVGGYLPVSGPQDAAMDGKLRRHPKIKTVDGSETLKMSECPAIYRWGMHPHHLSSRKESDAFYAEVGGQEVQPGRYRILPGWRYDYGALVKEHCRRTGEAASA